MNHIPDNETEQSPFTELLKKDLSVSTHIGNIQRLAIGMFRFYDGLSPPLMNKLKFKLKLKAENLYHGTESTSYLKSNICDILPEKLKNNENLKHFKNEL